jgi:hypothetical protein
VVGSDDLALPHQGQGLHGLRRGRRHHPTRCARSGSSGRCSGRGGSCLTRRAGP